jgi:hypothetical protein
MAICFSFSGEKSRFRYGLLFKHLQGLQKFCFQRWCRSRHDITSAALGMGATAP